MNNIHEKDWSEDSWSGHSGMTSSSDYCFDQEKDGRQLEENENQDTHPSEK